MPILLKCPKCRELLQLPEEMRGRSARCPKCLSPFRAGIPKAAPQPAAANVASPLPSAFSVVANPPPPPIQPKETTPSPEPSPLLKCEPPPANPQAGETNPRFRLVWATGLLLTGVLLVVGGLVACLVVIAPADSRDTPRTKASNPRIERAPWRTTADGSARIRIPKYVSGEKKPHTSPSGPGTLHEWTWDEPDDSVAYAFRYYTISSGNDVKSQDHFRSVKKTLLDRAGAVVNSQSDVTYHGQAGRQIVVHDKDDVIVALSYFIRHGGLTRLYLMEVRGPNLKPASKPVTAFFGSFDAFGIPSQFLSPFKKPGAREWINRIATTPDGRRLVASTSNDCLHIWNVATGELEGTIAGPIRPGIRSFDLLADGKTVVTLANNRRLQMWNLDSQKVEKMLPLPFPGLNCSAVACSPVDDRVLLSDTRGNHIVWNMSPKDMHPTLATQSDLKAMAWAPDGKSVVTASETVVQRWNAEMGTEENAVAVYEPGDVVTQFAHSPDGERLALLRGNKIRWLNAETSVLEKQCEFPQSLRACCWSPNGTYFVAGDETGTVWLWNGKTGEARAQWKRFSSTSDDDEKLSSPIAGLAFLPDGERLAVAFPDGVQIWSVDEFLRMPKADMPEFHSPSSDVPISVVAHKTDVKALRVVADNTLVTLSAQGIVHRWKTKPFRIVKASLSAGLDMRRGPITAAAISDDGKQVAATQSRERKIRIWNLSDGWLEDSPWLRAAPRWMRFIPKSGRLAFLNAGAVAFVDNPSKLPKPRSVSISVSSPTTAAFAPDGKTLVVGGYAEQFAALHLPKFQPAANDFYAREGVGPGAVGTTTLLEYSPDGRWLISVDVGDAPPRTEKSYALRVWDVKTRAEKLYFINKSAITSATVSHDGKRLAAGADDGSIWVWELSNGKNLVATNLNAISHMAFAPDDKQLIFSTGRHIHVWSNAVIETKKSDDKQNLTASVLVARKRDKYGMVVLNAGQRLMHMFFDFDHPRLKTIDRQGEMVWWDVKSGWREQRLSQILPGIATDTILIDAPDRESLLVADRRGNAFQIEFATGKRMPGPKRKANRRVRIRSAAYNRTGRIMAAGFTDGHVVFFNTENWEPLSEWETQQGSVDILTYSPSRRWLGASGYSVDRVQLRCIFGDGKSGPTEPFEKSEEKLGEKVRAFAFSADEKFLAMASRDGRLRLWDLAARKVIWEKQTDDMFLTNSATGRILAFHPGGQWLITGREAEDKRFLRIWEVKTGESKLLPLETPTILEQALFSDYGEHLAVRSGNVILLWDAATLWKTMWEQ